MQHILFLSLKIIGIIILVILALLLIVLSLALFFSMRYQLNASTEDGVKQLKINFQIYWCLHLVSAVFCYDEQKFKSKLRVGWKTIDLAKEESKTQKKEIPSSALRLYFNESERKL